MKNTLYFNKRQNSEGSISEQDMKHVTSFDFQTEAKRSKLNNVERNFPIPQDFKPKSNSDFVYNVLRTDTVGKTRSFSIGDDSLAKYIFDYIKYEESKMDPVEYDMLYKVLAKFVVLRNKFKKQINDDESFEAEHYKKFMKYRIGEYERGNARQTRKAI